MEAIKSYRIPVEAPKDLIEEYFKVKQKALDAIFSHPQLFERNEPKAIKVERKNLPVHA